jgi:hypothetical protein
VVEGMTGGSVSMGDLLVIGQPTPL